MLLRALIIASGLLVSFTTAAKDMSNWSDRTLCRVQENLQNDTNYHNEVRSRGLICPSKGNNATPYRKPYFQSSSALCDIPAPPPATKKDKSPPPSFDLIDHVIKPSAILAHQPPGQLMLVHDFNKDGMDDVLVNTGFIAPHLHLLQGQPTGKFLDQPLANADSAAGQISRIQILDFNQDGWSDFLLYTLDGDDQLFLNQQGKGFRAVLLVDNQSEAGSPIHSAGGDLADINDDGSSDLLIASHHGNNLKSPFIGSNEYAFSASGLPYSPLINQHLGQDLAAGDLNSDGFIDLVISLSSNPIVADDTAKTPPLEGSLYIIYGDGDLDFENNQHAFLGSSKDIGGPVKLIDLDGDEHLDIVHAYSRRVNNDTSVTGLQTYLNSKTTSSCFTNVSAHLLPELTLQPWTHVPSAMGIHPIRDIQISDANQDGKLDLWVQFQADIPNSGLLLQLDNQFRHTDINSSDSSNYKMLAGDFNGDGFNDIAKLINHGDSIEIQPWLHTSKTVQPLAPYQPEAFATITDAQQDTIQAFIDEKFTHTVTWQQLLNGMPEDTNNTVLQDWQGDYLLAWYWLPADASQVDFLGLDNIHWHEQGLKLTTKSLYEFHPTRSYREQLQFHSNRQQQFILRGKLDTQAGKPAQETELFGNLANRAALGVLEDGSIVLMELIKP